MSQETQVLVVGPSWVGDMVLAQSLFKRLRRDIPGAAIDVVAPAWSSGLLARMPEVRRSIALDVAHGRIAWPARSAVGRALRSVGYSQAIVLPRSLKAALVPFIARIPKRTGFRGEWRYGLINDMREFDADRLNQTVKRFVALGISGQLPEELETPAPKLCVDLGNRERLVERFGLDRELPAIGVMPGAEYGPAKRWPVERYIELTRRLVRRGYAVWVFGSARETALGRTIVDGVASSAVRDLCGATALVDVVDLLSLARVAVTNDSGLMHVAAAVGTHVVALFGSSTPDFTPPMTPRRAVLYLSLSCSPCFERSCPLEHLNCLRGISVADVESAVTAALASDASAERHGIAAISETGDGA